MAVCRARALSRRRSVHVPRHVNLKIYSLTSATDLPAARQVYSFNTGEEDCTRLITSWIEWCDKSPTHSSCAKAKTRKSSSYYRPSRLLRVYKVGQEIWLALRDTKLLPGNITYTTLSHCWGGDIHSKLGDDTHNVLSEGMPLECFPKTFQDAARLTINLGENHIWIDALCIFQDSEADWTEEGARMCETYSHSVVNIMAADSSNGDGGLFRPRNPLVASACYVKASWKDWETSNLICYDPNHYNNVVTPSVLISRAWVVQERLLSRRNVIFTRDQVYWECRAYVASEAFPDQVPEDSEWWKTWILVGIGRGLKKQKVPQQHWKDIVEKFTRCGLTNTSDKLVALSGLARDLSAASATNVDYEPLGTYLAGLWRSQLCHQLLWKRSVDGKTLRAPQYRAPTWSWASMDGPVEISFETNSQGKGEVLADILSARTASRYDDFGAVTSGSLLIRSFLNEVFLIGSDQRTSTFVSDNQQSNLGFRGQIRLAGWNEGAVLPSRGRAQDDSFQLSWDDGNEATQPLPVYFFLLRCGDNGDNVADKIEYLHGLLLRPTEAQRGQYRRVGTLTISNIRVADMLQSAQVILPDPLFIDCQIWQTGEGTWKMHHHTIEII